MIRHLQCMVQTRVILVTANSLVNNISTNIDNFMIDYEFILSHFPGKAKLMSERNSLSSAVYNITVFICIHAPCKPQALDLVWGQCLI